MTTAEIQSRIRGAAIAKGIPPSLALAVAHAESGFNPLAVGSNGEVGLFQLKAGAATDAGITDRYDVDQNITGGVEYLAQQYRATGGNIDATLWRYNAGPGNYANGVMPAHTTKYIANVTGDMPNWSDTGDAISPEGSPVQYAGTGGIGEWLSGADNRLVVLAAICLSLVAVWYILPIMQGEYTD